MKNAFWVTSILLLCLGYGCANISEKNKIKSINSVADLHTSQSSVDWEGTYSNIMPCADCEGIETIVRLGKNNTYQLSRKYLGKSNLKYNSSGVFTWIEGGNKILLDDKTDRWIFQVGENQLFLLDKEGDRITGIMADKYRLIKQDYTILEKYWKLVSIKGEPVKTIGKREAYVILKQDDNKLIGHGGCNAFNGSYSLIGSNQLRIEKISSTEMICAALSTEQKLIEVLQSVNSFNIKSDTLFLYKGQSELLASFEAVYLR